MTIAPILREEVTALPPEAFTHRMALLVGVAVLACERGMGTFRYADVVIAVWEMFPRKFSLPDHPQHPDSGAISAKMVGADGLVAKGLITNAPEAHRAWRPLPALLVAARAHLARYAPAPPPVQAPPRQRPPRVRRPPPAPLPVVAPAPPPAPVPPAGRTPPPRRPPPAPLLPELSAALRRGMPWPFNQAR